MSGVAIVGMMVLIPTDATSVIGTASGRRKVIRTIVTVILTVVVAVYFVFIE